MKVQDLMSTEVRCCKATDTLNRAAQLMWEGDFGCVPVMDDASRVVGMITDRDVSMAAYTQGRPLVTIPVASAMSKNVFVVRPKDDLAAAETIMRKRAVRRLPVVDEDGRVVGILSLNDLAREALRQKEKKGRELTPEELTETLGAVCAARVPQPAAARG